jgi:heme/copper-type cytochrome/quinol oxidase subunit 4
VGSDKQSAKRFKKADGDAENMSVDEAAASFFLMVVLMVLPIPVVDGDSTKKNKSTSMNIVKRRMGRCVDRLELLLLLMSEDGGCIAVVMFAMVVDVVLFLRRRKVGLFSIANLNKSRTFRDSCSCGRVWICFYHMVSVYMTSIP